MSLDVLRDQNYQLIRAEVRAMEQRANLERAVRDCVLKLGLDVSNVSEASGLTVREIRAILERVPDMDDMATLAGLR